MYAGLSLVGVVSVGCASNPSGGVIGEGGVADPRITAVDTAVPPRNAWIQLGQQAYTALFLVAPGHSVTLLYPADSATDNRLNAGAHQLGFEIPAPLVESDSQRIARIRDEQRNPARRRRSTTPPPNVIGPIPPATLPYLLLMTSQQELDYRRMIDRTAGVSIPNVDMEALNAVAKSIKATLPNEPRTWAGYYTPLLLRRAR